MTRYDSENTQDWHVVRRILDGEVDAFEILLQKYKNRVFEIVRNHVPYGEVPETAHQVFVRAYQSLPTFEGRGSFERWLFPIAVRTCCDYWRRQYKTQELPVSSLSDSHIEWLEKVTAKQSSDFFYEQSERKEAREVLDWALGRLSPEDRLIVELVYLEGLSGKEAAAILGWSIAKVKIRLFRSRKKLGDLFAGLIER